MPWTILRAVAPLAVFVSLPAAATPENFADQAEQLLAETYRQDGPGAAVVVIDHGRVVYAGARGLADKATATAITPDTVFRFGSLAKQFTAAVIVQLAQEGRLALSDPVRKFLPDFPEPGGSATIAQLLSHTSGIAEIPDSVNDRVAAGEILSTAALLASFKDLPAEYPAGTRHAYHGSNYALLKAIIEQVTGQPWGQVVADRLATPLGLTSIREDSAAPGKALGYSPDDSKRPPLSAQLSSSRSMGALMGSARDLARWSQALHHGMVVERAGYERMVAPTRLTDGTQASYGLGLDNRVIRGHRAIFHGGSEPGFSNGAIYIPDADLVVAILSNSDAPQPSSYAVSLQLAALALEDPFPRLVAAAIPHAAVEPLLGTYRSAGGERQFFARDGKLFMGVPGGAREVKAAGGGRFFYAGSLTWFDIARNAQGETIMTTYRDGARPGDVAVRIGPPAGAQR